MVATVPDVDLTSDVIVAVCTVGVLVAPAFGVVFTTKLEVVDSTPSCVVPAVVLRPLGVVVPGFVVVSSPATVVVGFTMGAVVVWLVGAVDEPGVGDPGCVETGVVPGAAGVVSPSTLPVVDSTVPGVSGVVG